MEVDALLQAIQALEAARAVATEDCARITASQRLTIEALHKENKHLQELKLEDSECLSSSSERQRFVQLVDLADTFTRKVWTLLLAHVHVCVFMLLNALGGG
jgi:hypothetical protein